jgi:hypothetical protein
MPDQLLAIALGKGRGARPTGDGSQTAVAALTAANTQRAR